MFTLQKKIKIFFISHYCAGTSANMSDMFICNVSLVTFFFFFLNASCVKLQKLCVYDLETIAYMINILQRTFDFFLV